MTCQLHEMRLEDQPFRKIREGSKTVELRINDVKRQKIGVFDLICFTNIHDGEKIRVRVLSRLDAPDFTSIYQQFPARILGYAPGEKADPRDMESTYPIESILAYGAVASEIGLVRPGL